MQMMYKTIYKALVEVGLENEYEPRGYLKFFRLGNRELSDNENTSKTVKLTGQNTPQVFCFYSLSIKYILECFSFCGS
jgi:phospholipase D1/2